jgi:hypothetical protein
VAGHENFLAIALGDGVSVYGITFDGAGLSLDQNNSGYANITVTACTFQNCRNTGAGGAWPFVEAIPYVGLTNANITHNFFQHWNTDTGIIGWGATNSHFDDNRFDDVNEAMHFDGEASGITILRNQFTHIHRYALEMQMQGSGLEIAFNWSSEPAFPDNANMIYSIACPTITKLHVHHNYAGGIGLTPIGANAAQSWEFEMAGADVEVDHNLVNVSFVSAITTCFQPPASTIHDHVFAGLKEQWGPMPSECGVAPAMGNAYNNQDLPNALPAPSAASVLSGAYWGTSSCTGE